MIELNLIDDQYPNKGFTHIRNVSRAILLDDNNNVCILHLYGDDIFGHRDYFETPGGGVDKNETPEEAVVRELDEEVGAKVSIITKIGIVTDYYNLLNRKNINHYYICKIKSFSKIHHESLGDSLIESIYFYPIDKVIDLYENMSDNGVSKLVKQRELPIINEAKNHLIKAGLYI